MVNWLQKKIAWFMISTSNVEKNALGQNGQTLETDINKHQRHTQGQLADSLINAEITQEVLNLKWRTYKILKATSGVKSTIVGYDEDNIPIVKTTKRNNKAGLKKVKLDDFDDYKLEMVLDNSEITLSTTDMFFNENLEVLDNVLENYDDNGSLISVGHATIGANELSIIEKGDRPIKIKRQEYTNFLLENFTKKLNIRKIKKDERLLEFYVSVYPDEYNKNSRLFLSSVKKVMTGKKESFLEFDGIEFLTYKTIGADDFLLYSYEIIGFDKIIEFNGFYVIKFKAKLTIDGHDILEQHKVGELEKKYENKDKK